MPVTPILLAGAGRMGGAILTGWRLSGAFSPGDLLVRDPFPGEAALAAGQAGVIMNPADAVLASVNTVLFAVKPQNWREAAGEMSALLAPNAVIVSILAGIAASEVAGAFADRPVARAMPTTAAAIGKATTSIFAAAPVARERAHALFEPLGAVVDLPDEDLMHVATAASGSAPAYLYAFIEALQQAATVAGLPAESAARLARSTITGAAALLDHTNADPAELRRQVTSPGGTTEAALGVLMGENGLASLLDRAVAAAVARSRALGVQG